jgi:hypothetical protein
MPTPVETAIDTYIRASKERDATAREALLATCWAEDGRLVTRSRVYRGLAELASMFRTVYADPRFGGIRLLALDARGTTFRMRSVIEWKDGTSSEFFDAGEINADGRICVQLAFAGGLD